MLGRVVTFDSGEFVGIGVVVDAMEDDLGGGEYATIFFVEPLRVTYFHGAEFVYGRHTYELLSVLDWEITEDLVLPDPPSYGRRWPIRPALPPKPHEGVLALAA